MKLKCNALTKQCLLREIAKYVLKFHPELSYSLYVEFSRRYEVVKTLKDYVPPPAKVLEAGASPFILSGMLSLFGYDITALDIEPEQYLDIAKHFHVKVIRCDLERNKIPLSSEVFDAVIFSEVMEHLNPYYLTFTLSELNRVLRRDGILILTTPNIASLFRRLKLLIGRTPIYRFHVREYTLNEVKDIIRKAGFEIIESGYTPICDKTFLTCKSIENCAKIPSIESYLDMVKFVFFNISKTNVLRLLAYPMLSIIKSLQMLIYVVAKKKVHVKIKPVKRWG